MITKYITSIFSTAFLLCVAIACHSGNGNGSKSTVKATNDTSGAPELKLLNRRVDVGYVPANTEVEGRYAFVNSGSKQLEIEFVNPDCICTGFTLSKKSIAPGDSSFLVLKMDTKDKVGDVQVDATISANTPTHLYKVSLVAKVK